MIWPWHAAEMQLRQEAPVLTTMVHTVGTAAVTSYGEDDIISFGDCAIATRRYYGRLSQQEIQDRRKQ